ncbi:Hypothetical predicted protein [Scomber scombrus]|uniref:Uncharacterized protein n=1 Tax=Scomber scombrus TaxID=13677 RepID=A0AAV1P1E2_SCOSC
MSEPRCKRVHMKCNVAIEDKTRCTCVTCHSGFHGHRSRFRVSHDDFGSEGLKASRAATVSLSALCCSAGVGTADGLLASNRREREEYCLECDYHEGKDFVTTGHTEDRLVRC